MVRGQSSESEAEAGEGEAEGKAEGKGEGGRVVGIVGEFRVRSFVYLLSVAATW